MVFNKETTKNIRKWLKLNGFKVGCRLGDFDAFYRDDNFITLGRTYDVNFDKLFRTTLFMMGLKNADNMVAITILHELGHSQTKDLFTDDEYMDYIDDVDEISEIEDDNKRLGLYWGLEVEYKANEWLVKFANENPAKVEELNKLILETI